MACAVDISTVQEISRQNRAAFVDQAPDHVAGIINLRGQVVTVLDLCSRLGLQTAGDRRPVYNVLVQSEGELIGLLVDDVDDIVVVEPQQIKSAPPHLGRGLRQYIDHVVEIDNEVMAVLAIDRLTA